MRLSAEECTAQVQEAAASDDLVKAVFSGRVRNAKPSSPRVDIRPVIVGGQKHLQHVRTLDGKHVSANVPISEAAALVDELIGCGYGNITITTTSRLIEYRMTKSGDVFGNVTARESQQDLRHDRSKRRLLDPADPLLVAVGISTPDGQVKSKWADKYRQVDDFLRIAATTLEKAIAAGHVCEPTVESPLRIVDLGCGHAYLTFGLQAWLERMKGWPAEIVGVDVKVESMQRNRDLVDRLGISNMKFHASTIAEYTADEKTDVVLALHACDTATDEALSWSVNHQVPVVLSVPCCHHNLQQQIGSEPPYPYGIVTQHGILRERIADLMTDALRAAILRERGYRVDVIEFVSSEHTPRNLMIRAVRTNAERREKDSEQLRVFLDHWRVQPALAQLLDK